MTFIGRFITGGLGAKDLKLYLAVKVKLVSLVKCKVHVLYMTNMTEIADFIICHSLAITRKAP